MGGHVRGVGIGEGTGVGMLGLGDGTSVGEDEGTGVGREKAVKVIDSRALKSPPEAIVAPSRRSV